MWFMWVRNEENVQCKSLTRILASFPRPGNVSKNGQIYVNTLPMRLVYHEDISEIRVLFFLITIALWNELPVSMQTQTTKFCSYF